ncbi:MAG: glycoside hydrolase family 5 protein [Melioribacteraceae bacterium]|nr:glycoside hydrolase family 5 protein [Melioribacteraceae bacterium]MCF8356651.1 glycoside hydrolase family 5 protein [Melioribacteraceae bacterium]MCF8393876.1 glycoside hydrolase family 5 protein [Melioribacteraceae bacterium]MCF8419648.1 glycoside hydrolase family 5 protein [Melioribacteraceae bacterium]
MSFKRVLILLIFVASVITAQQKYYTVDGRNVIDPNGDVFIIKGVNLGNWLVPEGYMFKFKKANSPRMVNDVITELIGPAEAKKFWIDFQDNYITSGDIKYLKSSGLNSIRVPFNYKLFCDETYLWNTTQRGFELIDRLLEWCRSENLPIILDMHCAPGGQTGDNIDDSYGYPWLFINEESQQQIIEIWKRIAEHYADDPMVLGYDLMNEPIAHYFEDEGLYEKLEPLYKRIVSAIREVDTNHIIVLGGARWNTNFSVFGEPFDDKLIYEFHKYWMPPEQKEIQEYVDFREKYNVPIYMGESGENEDEWIFNFRELLDSNNIGWHFWTYKKMDTERCPVQFNKPGNYDLIIEYAESDRSTYANMRENKPGIEKVKKALEDFIDESKFENCFPNNGYLWALGLRKEK